MNILRIVEWNVGLKKEKADSILKLAPQPDVVVLAEVKDGLLEQYENYLSENS